MKESSNFYESLKAGYKNSSDAVQIFYVIVLVILALSLFFVTVTTFAALLLTYKLKTIAVIILIAFFFSLYLKFKGSDS